MRAAVDSLLDQDYDGPFEVVLALGPSIDGTNELVDEHGAGRPAHPRHRRTTSARPRPA